MEQDTQLEDGLREILDENTRHIYEPHKVDKRVQDKYNFRTFNLTLNLLERQLRYIFLNQRRVFKLNLSFGFTLRDSETGQFRYYYPSNNQRYLERPVLISDAQSLNQFINKLKNEDIIEWCLHQRPSTKWSVTQVTNVNYYVNKLSFPIGANHGLPT